MGRNVCYIRSTGIVCVCVSNTVIAEKWFGLTKAVSGVSATLGMHQMSIYFKKANNESVVVMYDIFRK